MERQKRKTTPIPISLVVLLALFLIGPPARAVQVGADLTVCGQVQSYTAATAVAPGAITIDGKPFVIAAGTQISNDDLLVAGANVCLQASLDASGHVTSPASVSANVSSTAHVCGTVTQYTAATAALPGSLTIGGQTFPIAAGTSISDANLITSGANLCLSATLNGAGQIVAPSSVSANATTTVTVCGVVSAYTAATANAAGSITIGGRTFPIAAGTTIDGADLIHANANLCLSATVDGAGQIVAPSSVSANATSTVTICGVVSAYSAATADLPGSITIDGQHYAIAAGATIGNAGLIHVGADLCLEATLDGAGQVTAPSSVSADVRGSIHVCGTVTAFTAATASAPGSITIDGHTFTIAAGTDLDGSGQVQVGADFCLDATVDAAGEIDTGSILPAGQSADLSISKSATPNPVASGQPLTYTIIVANHGPDGAEDVSMTDTLPAGVTFVSATPSQGTCSGNPTVVCHLGSIGNGGTATIRIVVTAGDPGTVTNSASVTSATPDPDTSNNHTGNVGTTITGGAGGSASADLGVTLSAAPDPVIVGQVLTYTITVHNFGPDAATGVVVSDDLPPGVAPGAVSPDQGSCSGSPAVHCTLGTLAAGATTHVRIGVTPSAPGVVTDTATVSSAVFDGRTSNNSASVTTVVLGPPGGGGGGQTCVREILFPGAGETGGENGAVFRTAARILDFGNTEQTVFAEWFPLNAGGASGPSAVATLTIGPGEVASFDEVVSSLFHAQGLGSIRLLSAGAIAADALIENDQRRNPEIHGIYGSFAKGHLPSDAIGDGAILLLSHDPGDPTAFRTNLGYWNASPHPAVVTLNAFLTDGTPLGSRTMTVPGWANALGPVFDLIAGVPADHRVQDDFYVTFHTTGGRLFVYGAVTNNSTNDGYVVEPWALAPDAGCP